MFQQIHINNFEIFFCEFFLSLIILILLIFGTFFRLRDRNYLIKLLNNVILFLLVLCFLLELNIQFATILANGLFYSDFFIKTIKLLLILSTMNSFFIQKEYITNQNILFFENYILMLISLLGLMFLISSNHFLSFYLSLELQSLSFYILALSQRNSTYSVEASLKYFILGAIASGFLLYGISYLYGVLGTLNFGQVFSILFHSYFEGNLTYLMITTYGLFFFLCGVLFKVGAAPFHMWLPDVYEGSPNHISLFFATVPKIALIGFLLNFFFNVISPYTCFFEYYIYTIAVLSILVGSFGSLLQFKIKRFLGYSSITHVGFLLVGFIDLTGSNFINVFFYLIVYVIMSINIWNIYLSLFLNQKPLTFLTDLTNLYKYNKWISSFIMINFFSMAGIPPLIGFFSKIFLFLSVLSQYTFLIVFFSIIFSAVSAFYYIRIIKVIYFDKKNIHIFLNTIAKSQSFMISITSQFILFFFFFPNNILIFLENIYLHIFFETIL